MPQQGTEPYHQYILAKHLEVFVPKPKTRELEVNLIDWLDHLLIEAKIPRGAYGYSQPEGDHSSEFSFPCPPILAEEFKRNENKRYWENIIYGYSTYETDGHFVDFDEESQIRTFEKDFREQTLVIKFLLTNYATAAYRGIVPIPTARIPGIEFAIVPAYAYPDPSVELQNSYYRELYLTNLHYNDLTNHIITGIAETVLWKETEVWSHAWYTVLDRRSMNSKRTRPIILSEEEKVKRFGEERQHEVMCVMDYARVDNGSH